MCRREQCAECAGSARTLIRELHPDRGGESLPAAQVNIARDILLNAVTRHEYDEARREWHESNPLLSAFTDAGQQLHRERAQSQQAPAAGPRRSACAAPTRPVN